MSFAIDGAAWAGFANRFAQALEGLTPDLLTPVTLASDGTATPTGDPIPFVSDAERNAAKATESGLVVTMHTKVVFVRAEVAGRPVVGDHYTWSGRTWQVASAEYDRAAGADWPHCLTLVAHVSDATQVPT